MKKHLYYFSFETPEMNISNKVFNGELEITEYFYVLAVTENEATMLGTMLANVFLAILYQNRDEKILVENYAHGILDANIEEFELKFIESLPCFEQVDGENKEKILRLLLTKYVI
jgi:hypothetical protein